MAPDADDLLARQLAELRREYLTESDRRVAELRTLRAQLERAPSEALPGLRQAFHRLAGSGGSYGFPDVSARSREGEQIVQRMQAGGSTISPDDLRALDQSIGAVEQAFAEARASHG